MATPEKIELAKKEQEELDEKVKFRKLEEPCKIKK